MLKTQKITYRVFLFERVKKKVKVLGRETYPLQIRLTSGARTLYFKSYFFSLMQQEKYGGEFLLHGHQITLEDIIASEEALVRHLVHRERESASLDAIREEYGFLSKDILQAPDAAFKLFLADFFYAENLPAYSLLIKNDGANHTSEFLLHNLKKSLNPAVYKKLLHTAVQKAPPYIPLVAFFRKQIAQVLPVFPIYQWKQEGVEQQFIQFIEKKFPEYIHSDPVAYVNAQISTL